MTETVPLSEFVTNASLLTELIATQWGSNPTGTSARLTKLPPDTLKIVALSASRLATTSTVFDALRAILVERVGLAATSIGNVARPTNSRVEATLK